MTIHTSVMLQVITVLQSLIRLRSNPISVFILGMHRSGTSCLTGILNENGLYIGDHSTKDFDNKKGNQESFNVNRFNETLLNYNNATWYSPQHIKYVPVSIKYSIEKYRLKMLWKTLQASNTIWGLKDPRMLFCWSAWIEEDTTFIGTFRHPKKVALSLQKRYQQRKDKILSQFNLIDWEELWFKYNVELISLYQKKSFPIVNFDWQPTRYKRAVNNIVKQLGLAKLSEDSSFFDRSLINQDSCDEITNIEHQKIYSQLIEIAEFEESKYLG